MEFLKEVKLSKFEKVYLYNLLTESIIGDIKLIQNKLYISMFSSRMIILKNSDENLYHSLKKFQNENQPEVIKREYKRCDSTLWSNAQIESLKKNYYIKSLEELSKELKKSLHQISIKVMELKLVNNRIWNKDELNFLIKNINISNHELAQFLRRTIYSIKSKKRLIKNERLNLNKIEE
ncbi:hypothetical protein [Cetobacterium sp.]|uniref:hypothetical protein n=1 Tax=Cetobacterium sp. TaxID=2071632 RepID=UPI003F3D8B2D